MNLPDAQWCRLAPVLPAEKPRVGRPNHPHRRIINGILWILATGAPWRDLPERYGPWHTISSRFYRWQRASIWARVLAALQRCADQHGQLDWSMHLVDSTIVRAHQHATGARGGQSGEALGRSRGGFSTKLHLRADRSGKPLVLLITAGERHDQTMFESLLTQGQVRRKGRGRPRQRSGRVVGDKGYSTVAGIFGAGCNATAYDMPFLTNATNAAVCTASATASNGSSIDSSNFGASPPATRNVRELCGDGHHGHHCRVPALAITMRPLPMVG